jgi:predicted nucleotidyltransferase
MGKERERAEKFARRLAETYGDSLRTVVLYGSAARGDYREGTSDLNLLVVLRELDDAALRRGSALAREWVSEKNPPPLLFSEAEWRASADVFPIEYTDIRDANVLLFGDDPFAGLEIGWEHLRLQCEHELKGKKIQLRERYMIAAESPEELGRLLLQSFPTFLTLFRTALRLAGDGVPREPGAVLDALAARVGFDPEPVRAILQARGGATNLLPSADDPIVTGYLSAVSRTAEWLDGMSSPGPAARV